MRRLPVCTAGIRKAPVGMFCLEQLSALQVATINADSSRNEREREWQREMEEERALSVPDADAITSQPK